MQIDNSTYPPIQEWQPVRHTIFKNDELADTIHKTGFAVVSFLNEEQLAALKDLYHQTHNIEERKGGMFYSVYSQDLEYRTHIHHQIETIIDTALRAYIQDYKTIINSFIVKASGPESEFYVHQDTTGLDEWKYSPLSFWIPLTDITKDNGALCLMPQSQWLFSPYRSISFDPPFQNIVSKVRGYLEPIYMKAGQALIFDNRVIHNSLPNLSGHERVVVMSGVFPKNAELITCFKAETDAPIELIAHEDDYLLKNMNFLIDCHKRPTSGTTLGFVQDTFPMMTETEFVAQCEQRGIFPLHLMPETDNGNCHIIGEPVYNEADSLEEVSCESTVFNSSDLQEKQAEKGWWERLKSTFRVNL